MEIRDVNREPNNWGFTIFCPVCEEKFGAKCEIWYGKDSHKEPQLRKFVAQHEHDGADENWFKEVDIIKAIYEENPGITFEEVKEKFLTWKLSVLEMKSDL